MANFRHMLPEDIEPFVFLSQVQQVLYADDRHTLWWNHGVGMYFWTLMGST
jgi:hypothetical protein